MHFDFTEPIRKEGASEALRTGKSENPKAPITHAGFGCDLRFWISGDQIRISMDGSREGSYYPKNHEALSTATSFYRIST